MIFLFFPKRKISSDVFIFYQIKRTVGWCAVSPTLYSFWRQRLLQNRCAISKLGGLFGQRNLYCSQISLLWQLGQHEVGYSLIQLQPGFVVQPDCVRVILLFPTSPHCGHDCGWCVLPSYEAAESSEESKVRRSVSCLCLQRLMPAEQRRLSPTCAPSHNRLLHHLFTSWRLAQIMW